MELNDIMTVTLTEAGAKKLNAFNREMQIMVPSQEWKIDYITGDDYTCELWYLFYQFGELCRHGLIIPFINMRKQ